MTENMRLVSIVFLLKEDKILLAMKKRGFGEGLWNGAGGKQDSGETIVQTAVRECQEEIFVTPKDIGKVAVINFYFPPEKAAQGFNQQAHVYVSKSWTGEPKESEEMRPEWFDVSSLPYDSMWRDDTFWLPLVLDGKKITADFHFDNNDEVLSHSIKEVKSFS